MQDKAITKLVWDRRRFLNRAVELEQEAQMVRASVARIEAKLVASGYNVEALARRKPRTLVFDAKRIKPLVIDMLRRTDRPLTTRQIAVAMSEHANADYLDVRNRVSTTLHTMRSAGFIRSKMVGNRLRWSLVE